MGLWLAIVARSAERLGHRVSVDSEFRRNRAFESSCRRHHMRGDPAAAKDSKTPNATLKIFPEWGSLALERSGVDLPAKLRSSAVCAVVVSQSYRKRRKKGRLMHSLSPQVIGAVRVALAGLGASFNARGAPPSPVRSHASLLSGRAKVRLHWAAASACRM
jgi:hypothetical protein